MNFLKNKYARIVTVLLMLQGAGVLRRRAASGEHAAPAPLMPASRQLGGWQMYKDVKIEQETLDVLKADDTLNRVYLNPARTPPRTCSSRFSRRSVPGRLPHSPKNCLPGNGYEPLESGRFTWRFRAAPSRSRSTGT